MHYVVIGGAEPERHLVVVNREPELTAPEVGVAQVVEEVGIFHAVVDAGAPFVDGSFEIALLVRLGAGLDARAFFGGKSRAESHCDCK